MPQNSPAQEIRQKIITLRTYLLLAIAGGIFTLWGILSIPGDPKNFFILNLSTERLALCGLVLAVILAAGWLCLQSWLRAERFAQTTKKLAEQMDQPKIWGAILILSLMGIISGANFILFIPEITEPVTQAYYVRLQPFILWMVILCSQNLLALPLLRFGFSFKQLLPKYRIFYAIFLIFGFFLLLWAWIGQTGYGIKYIDVGIGWYFLGTPLLETQILLAWGISLAFLLMWTWKPERADKWRWTRLLQKDVAICILIWVAAFTIWMAQPLAPNWFASEPRPPNLEFYPNSDASVYDITAQNLLIGEGFKTRGSPFTLRPMYALFLAWLHKLAGLSYEPIIGMQVAVLALIPVLIYLIAKTIHRRVSGILAAALLILREMNAIHLADKISESHAKLLMPFLPTALGILAFIWLMIAWLENPQKRQNLALISGGVMGIAMLIRPEVAILLPFTGIIALLQIHQAPKEWLKGMLWVACGLILMLLPWLWRNYQLTGTIFIDSPTYRLDLFARRYREDPIGFVLPTPGPVDPTQVLESPTQTPGEILPQPGETAGEQTERLGEGIVEYAQQNPKLLTNFVLNHFFNNLTQTVMYFPSTFRAANAAIEVLGTRSPENFGQLCCSAENYLSRLPFWYKWEGNLPSQSVIPTAVTLLILAVGISAAFKYGRFTGLLPLLAVLGYYLVNALARNSGGRYNVPVDWIGLLYYSIGLGQLTLWGISLFRELPGISKETRAGFQRGSASRGKGMYLGIAAGILILGAILPIVEKGIPAMYSPSTFESKLQDLWQSQREGLPYLETFLNSGGLVLQGRALYPRFNVSTEMGSIWNFYQHRSFDYFDFYLSSPADRGIVLPTSEEPAYFPHASDVLVFGCSKEDIIDALAVVIFSAAGEPEEIIFRSPSPDQPACPLP